MAKASINTGEDAQPVHTRTTAGTEESQAVVVGIDGSDSVVPADAANGLDVDVTRVQGNVAVTAASLPLPTGATTEATLAAVNTKLGGTIAVSQASVPSHPVTDGGGSLTVDSAQLPTAITAAGNLKVALQEDGGAVIGVDDNGGSLTVDGSVSVSNFPAAQPVTDNAGSLTTDTPQLPAALTAAGNVKVSLQEDGGAVIGVDDNGGSLTVDGTVAATQSGTWTVQPGNTPNTTAWKVDASGVAVPVTDNAGSLTVDAPVGTPVFTRLSDGTAALVGQKVMASSLPVVVSSDQTVIPVSDNAGSLTVDSPVGTPVFTRLSDGAAALIGQKAMAASLPVVVASDQAAIAVNTQPTGATNVLKTGTITTTAVTADQVVLTYTVTAAKTFYIEYLIMYGRLTVLAATATILGAISLESPSGTKLLTLDDVNPTTSELEFNPIVLPSPIPIAAGVVVRVVVTPAAATSMLWRANFGGYEK